MQLQQLFYNAWNFNNFVEMQAEQQISLTTDVYLILMSLIYLISEQLSIQNHNIKRKESC